MFTLRWRLFRLFGIPISVDASWFIILILLSWNLTDGFYRKNLPDLPEVNAWLLGIGTAVAFFTCIVLHEMGHALVARYLGMPIRGITLFIFGGVAELGAEPLSAGSEFFMAIGGPAVSAVLASGFYLLSGLGADAGWSPVMVLPLDLLASINFMVLLFNLVPAFPLDGGRVLRSLLWVWTGDLRKSTFWASLAGQGTAWLLIGLGVVQVIGQNWGGVWFILIGFFLNNAARAGYQQVLIRQFLQGEPVRRFMNDSPIVVAPTLDLRHWVEDYVYRFHRKTFPVASDGHLEGFINTRALERIPKDEWDRHSVEEVMQHDVNSISVSPETDALEALGRMQRTGSSRLLVTEGDHLVGIVSLKDLLRFLHMKIELENTSG
jgi:Zn-dependent protease